MQYERLEKGKTPVLAVCYDFDRTLTPGDMQAQGFIQSVGADVNEFWKQSNEFAINNDMDMNLAYMLAMVKRARGKFYVTREALKSYGAKIKLYEGAEGWFDRITGYGRQRGIAVEHYVISSGIKEMIEGTPIAHEFENIYACSFLYNKEGIAYWPAVAVDYTTKTQFLFKINKGIKQVSDNRRVNQYIPDEKRPIPFPRMIYFGDGETDVPCMKMVKEHGGHSIAVYDNEDKQKTACQLVKEGRVNFMCSANYSKGSVMNIIVKRILDKIKADFEFDRLIELNQKKAWK